MSDHALTVVGLVMGLLLLGLVALAALALWLGRPLRAHGRARLGPMRELAVGVEVPEATRADAPEVEPDRPARLRAGPRRPPRETSAMTRCGTASPPQGFRGVPLERPGGEGRRRAR